MPSVTTSIGGGSFTRLWGAYCDASHAGDRGGQLWLSPTPGAAAGVLRRVAALPAGALLSPGVGTGQQFANKVLALAAGPSRVRPCDTVVARRILSGILTRKRAERRIEHYGRLEPIGALVDLLLAEIDHASGRGARPAALLAKAKQAGAARQLEFAEVYAAYRDALPSMGLLDRHDRWRCAADLLNQGQAGLPTIRFVAVESLEATTKSEREFLAAVLRRADHAVLGFPWARNEKEIASELRWIEESVGPVEGVSSSKSAAEAKPLAAGSALEFLDAWLFKDPLSAPPPPAETDNSLQTTEGRVRVLTGRSTQDEIGAVSREVKRCLLDGVAAEDIVVTTPNLRGSLPRLVEAFRSVGVPWSISASSSIDSAPVVGALMSLLALPRADWRHADVLRVLTSPSLRVLEAFAGETTTLSTREIRRAGFSGPRAAAELAVRRLLLPNGRDALVDQLRRELAVATSRSDLASSDKGAADPRDVVIAQCGIGAVLQLGAALDRLPASETPLGWFDAMRDLLDRVGYAAPTLEADKTAETDVAALETLEEAFASLERLARWRGASPPRLSFSEVAELLDEWSSRLRLESRNAEEGRVRVLTLDEAMHERPRRLFVLGLVERSLPRALPLSDPFVAVSTEQHDAHQQRERQRFRRLVTTATECVTLSYPALDDKAQPLNPSSFVAEVQRLFQPRNLEASAPGDSSPPCAADLRRRAVADLNEGDSTALRRYASAPATAAHAPSLFDGLAITVERSTGDTFGASEGVLAGEDARAAFALRYGPDHLWSPSQLELYAECPFKFFMRHGLGVDALDTLTLDIDYRRRGSLLHDAMVRFHQQVGDAGQLTDDVFLASFKQAVASAAKSVAAAPHERPLANIEALQAEKWAPQYRDQLTDYETASAALDSPMRPAYFEARFGPSRYGEVTDESLSTDEPFRLPLGNEDLLLTGRIDRVDLGSIGGRQVFNVIDYKTAATVKPSVVDARAGRQLQLYLYAMAAEQLLLRDRDAAAWRLGYWAVRDGGFKPPKESRREVTASEATSEGEVRPTEAWQSLESEVKETLRSLVAGIRQASFPMHNSDTDCAGRCEFAGVCRVGQARGVGKLPPSDAASEAVSPTTGGDTA